MDINMTESDGKIYLCGKDTFPIKETLKRLGGEWDPTYKCWKFNVDNLQTLQALIRPDKPLKRVIPELPTHLPPGITLEYRGNKIYICGKTYEYKNIFKGLGAKYDNRSRCWTLDPNLYNDLVDLLDVLEAERIESELLAQQSKINADRQEIIDYYDYEERIRTFEPEQEYVPCIREFTVKELKSLSDEDYDVLVRKCRAADVKALTDQWYDKIEIRDIKYNGYQRSGIATYTGGYKPPDQAFAIALTGWYDLPYKYKVNRIDYKVYSVEIETYYTG